jgi:hypothetical protein
VEKMTLKPAAPLGHSTAREVAHGLHARKGRALQAAALVAAKGTDLLSPKSQDESLLDAFQAFSKEIEALQENYMSGTITANTFLKQLKANGYSHHDAKAELANVNETLNYIGNIPVMPVDTTTISE